MSSPSSFNSFANGLSSTVAQRQPQSPANLTITLADIGGEAALEGTLRDFYVDTINALPKRSAAPSRPPIVPGLSHQP